MLEVRSVLNPQEEAQAALTAHINSALSHMRPVLVMCSGGSAFSILPEAVSGSLEFLTITVLDERFGVPSKDRNWDALSDTTFFKNMRARGATTIDPTPREGESLSDCARRYEDALRAWEARASHRGAIIATMGIGADGHTAGIFPSQKEEDFKDRFLGPRLAVGYDAGPEATVSRERITVTATFLKNSVHAGVAYAVGEQKCPVLESLPMEIPLSKMPAGVVRSMKSAVIYTDCKF